MVTPREVYELAVKAHDLHNQPYNRETFQANRIKEQELETESDKLNENAAPGLSVGRLIYIPHADGYAVYQVQEVRPRSIIVQHMPFGDAWQSPVVSKNSTMSIDNAKRHMKRENPLFGSVKVPPIFG